MIKLQIIGNLGKDATTSNVNGKNVINFSVCHTEKYKDNQGNQQSKSTWVEAAYWTDKTGIVPYLKKGTQVYVEGQPEVKTYQTNDGRQGASLSLRVGQVQLLGGGEKQDNQQQGGYQQQQTYPAQQTQQQPSDMPADDLPF